MPSTVSREDFRTRGPVGEVREFAEENSATFVAGDFVLLSTNGKVNILCANATNVGLEVALNSVLRALEPASGTVNTMISCEIIPQNQEFRGPLVSGTAQVDSAQTMVNDRITLRFINAAAPAGVTTRCWGGDASNTTNATLVIVEFDRAEAIGVSGNYHLTWFRLLDGARFSGG